MALWSPTPFCVRAETLIKELVTLKEAVAATPRPGEDDAAHLRNASIGLAMKSVADARLFAEYLNSADPGGVLGHVDVPLSSVLEFGGAIAEGQRVNAQLDCAVRMGRASPVEDGGRRRTDRGAVSMDRTGSRIEAARSGFPSAPLPGMRRSPCSFEILERIGPSPRRKMRDA